MRRQCHLGRRQIGAQGDDRREGAHVAKAIRGAGLQLDRIHADQRPGIPQTRPRAIIRRLIGTGDSRDRAAGEEARLQLDRWHGGGVLHRTTDDLHARLGKVANRFDHHGGGRSVVNRVVVQPEVIDTMCPVAHLGFQLGKSAATNAGCHRDDARCARRNIAQIHRPVAQAKRAPSGQVHHDIACGGWPAIGIVNAILHGQPIAHWLYRERPRQRHIDRPITVAVERAVEGQQIEQIAGEETSPVTRPETLHRHRQVAVGKGIAAGHVGDLPQVQVGPAVVERQGKVVQGAPRRLRVDHPCTVERIHIRRSGPEAQAVTFTGDGENAQRRVAIDAQQAKGQ